MPLRTNNRNKYNVPYPNPTAESHTIKQQSDWGIGIIVENITFDTPTPVATFEGGGAITMVSTTPAAGQCQPWYTDRSKLGFWEFNAADVGKVVNIAVGGYYGQGSTFDADQTNEMAEQINANTSDIATLGETVGAHSTTISTLSQDLEALKAGGTGGGVAPILTVSPANGSTGNLTSIAPEADANKWYDDEANLTDKFKVYSDSNRTTEITGTVSRVSSKKIRFTPSVAFTDNVQIFPRVLSTMPFADGTTLGTVKDWAFVVGTIGNLAPTATVQAITGTTTLGSNLTGHYTYSDNENDPEGTSTFRWLRNGVAITGATALTYVLVEADIGTTITFEVTPVASTGTTTGSAVTSAGLAIPANISRSSTGKLFYDDFTDGTLTPWTIPSGSSSLTTVASDGGENKLKVIRDSTNPGQVEVSFTADTRPIYATFKRKCTSLDMPWQARFCSGTDWYGVVSDGASKQILYRSGTSLNTITRQSPATEENVELKVGVSDLSMYIGGTQNQTISDSVLTGNFDKFFLLGSGSVSGDGAWFDNVAICKSHLVTCSGIPTGYKFRVGGKVATESSGTASVDCSGVTFPQSLVEVLNASDVVVKTLTLTNDVWGGDAYAY